LAVSEASELVEEYYKELGLSPEDVLGRNAPELRRLLPKGRDSTDTPSIWPTRSISWRRLQAG
jgi:hypothetical protein